MSPRFAARYVVAVRPADVGSRVSLRLTLPEGGLTDVVGELVAWTDDVLRVRRRDGSLTEVSYDRLVAAKVVPPGAPRRTHLDVGDRELEQVAALGWRGLETERLGGWLLRAAGGFTRRANSVLPLGDPELPLDDALTRVREWYAARGLRPRFQLPLPLCGDLDAALDQRGWVAPIDVLVMTADVPDVLALLPSREDVPAVRLAPEPDTGWLATYRYRGGDLPAGARGVLLRAERPLFASVIEDDATLAVGRASVDRGWVGITALDVVPAARRRGLARHVLRGLLAHARSLGARHVYLQVSADNEAAIGLYEGLRFAVHHRYRYRMAP
jgi:ribosomal protein S18 acetylase RimI-like enzyme